LKLAKSLKDFSRPSDEVHVPENEGPWGKDVTGIEKNTEVFAMRINHNISSMIGQGALASQQNALAKSLEKLSTGMRINRASDDAAGLSVSESMRSKIRGMGRAKSNAEDGIALLQIAEGATGEINNILQRMRELSIQSATDTMTTTERSYTDKEFGQLMNEITRISSSASYNGMTLLDGAAGSFGVAGGQSSVLHIGAGSSTTVDRISITISAMTLGALGMNSTTTTVSTSAGALASLSMIDMAIKSVNTMRSDMGAYVNRLEFAISNLSNQVYNTQDAESRIRDVDFAQETTEFTRAQILSQSATSMLAQANQVPQGVLSLLGH
jgi:flagellin